ncbi:MAG: glutathione S-transferase family protein [Thermodesulfobacteriota bacterium]
MSSPELSLVGAYGSPYSRKMRAVLRYRRIPFRWVLRASPDARDLPAVPVALIPVLVFPGTDGAERSAMIDSTFQIRRLEAAYRERSIIPPDPATAFLDALVEDYADEWLTKAMFHYRWAYEADARKASRVLPLDVSFELSPARHEAATRAFAERQIGRLGVVGSSAATRETIEASYVRLLDLLAAHLTERPFLFGARPASADFALYGQLTQLAQFDPTPSAVAAERAPRVVAWVNRVEDLAWLEVADGGGWAPLEPLPATLRALLCEVGRTYVPFLLANDDALARGADAVVCRIDGARWEQKPFPYQGKCLRWLRAGHAALGDTDRARVDAALAGTGCEVLFGG